MGVSVQKVGDWKRARRALRTLPKRFAKAKKLALNAEGKLLQKMIRDGLLSQSPGGKRFRGLSPLTLATRRVTGGQRGSGSRILVVNGDLARSIRVVRRGSSLFIGVPRRAKTRSGRSMADIAALNEFGSRPIVIRVTPAMARFLAVLMSAAGRQPRARTGGRGTGVIVIRIPKRPFLRPAFEQWGTGAKQRLLNRMIMLIPELQAGGG